MSIIEVSHVTKEFRLGQIGGLEGAIGNALARLRGRSAESRPPFKALKDITFAIEPGEVLGIIGHNGAGKSTLLKLLAGISRPTHGAVRVDGQVAPLIEVGAGLVPDLTGRENIHLNATILGMRRAEIRRKFDEIVAFAELEDFLDTPIKRYSSGMAVRLGFAVASSVEAPILIVDEVLAVGDLAFQRKCFDRMEELIKRKGRTVLLVSHNIRHVARLCTRVILMDHGRLLRDGDPIDVCNAFYEQSDRKIYEMQAQASVKSPARLTSSGEIELLSVMAEDRHGHPTECISYLSDVVVALKFKVTSRLSRPIFGIGVHTTDFVYLATNHSAASTSPESLGEGVYEVRCLIRRFPFLPGVYALRVGVAAGEARRAALYVENARMLRVVSDDITRSDPDASEGFVAMDASWEIASARHDPTVARSAASR